MNLVRTTVLEQGASLKAECQGDARMLSSQGLLVAAPWKREKIAMTTLGTWGLTSKKRWNLWGGGWDKLPERLAQSQVWSSK